MDHAWTFELTNARKTLASNAGLLARMLNLMCVDGDELTDQEKVDSVMEKIWK